MVWAYMTFRDILHLKEHSLPLRANVESSSDLPETTEMAFKALNTRNVRRDDRLMPLPLTFGKYETNLQNKAQEKPGLAQSCGYPAHPIKAQVNIAWALWPPR